MTLHAIHFAATATVALAADAPALTETARLAVSINDKHREVVALGRTAKEIAAEIGEELIKVKQKLAHGEFMPWVAAYCTFKRQTAQDYMKVAKAKYQSAGNFTRCESIADVLALGKPKPEPKPVHRSATLADLRKVERLRALRDDPAVSAGEKDNAQRKLDEIEKEIGPVEAQPKAKAKPVRPGQSPRHEARLKAAAVMDRVAPTLVGNPRSMLVSAIMIAYGDTPEKIDELLNLLKGTKR